MLVLSRRMNYNRPERIVIILEDGRQIWVSLEGIETAKARIGIDAPDSIVIHREEVLERVEAEKRSNGGPAK